MQFPESWLREFCNPPISTQQLADTLTMAGLEVEEMHKRCTPLQQSRGGAYYCCRAAPECGSPACVSSGGWTSTATFHRVWCTQRSGGNLKYPALW
jgi:hypothetical protein